MKTILLAAGAVAAALTAGQALAARSHHASTAAGPKQPIPYAELGSYLKASPGQRAKKDWWSQASLGASASTGTSANTTATTDASASASTPTPSTPPSLGGGTSASPATPPVSTPPASDTTSPSTTATTPSQPVNPPPK